MGLYKAWEVKAVKLRSCPMYCSLSVSLLGPIILSLATEAYDHRITDHLPYDTLLGL